MIRLLTASAIAVLAVLCAAGTGMAAPFTHGYTDIIGATAGGVTDAIYHCVIAVPETNLPFTLVGIALDCSNSDATTDTTALIKGAFYSVDGTTVLDSTETLILRSATSQMRVMNFTTHYQLTDSGHYNIAFWGDTIAGYGDDSPQLELDTTTYDTTWVMTAQSFGNAWPTLADNNRQGNKHILAYIIGIKGDAAIVGTMQTEDTYIKSGTNADKNYGGATTAEVGGLGTPASLFRCLNIEANIGTGKTIDACSLWVYSAGLTGGSADCFRVFKYGWNEGNVNGTDPADAASGEGVATWNDWSNDDEEWTTAGCANADDGGADNTGDGTGADRTATALSTVSLSTGGWNGFAVTSLAQEWYAETAELGGVLIKPASGSSVAVSVSSSETTSNWPVWQFYTSAPATTKTRRPAILLGDQQ